MLTFNLKKEWFDKIKSGEKTHEYRLANYYWTRRICNQSLKDNNAPMCFACGYPKKDDKERRLYAVLKSYEVTNGLNTDLKVNKPVFDIEFELIKEGK